MALEPVKPFTIEVRPNWKQRAGGKTLAFASNDDDRVALQLSMRPGEAARFGGPELLEARACQFLDTHRDAKGPSERRGHGQHDGIAWGSASSRNLGGPTYGQVWFIASGVDLAFATLFAFREPTQTELEDAERMVTGVRF